MKVVEIQVEEGGNKLVVSQADLPSQIEMLFMGEVGDKITLTIAEMPDKAYINLPEFTGW